MQSEINWIIDQHRKTNHFYDKNLPYDFHLQMVANEFEDYRHLLNPETNDTYSSIRFMNEVELACWGHDLIEDTRTNYNDCMKILGINVAEIIYACTNNKGRNRADRANAAYYEGIRNTKGATFVKLCDRLANVRFSKLMKSKMFSLYQKEYHEFIKGINGDKYPEMVKELKSLLELP